jgi:rhodanese-related sulfurtransferase
MFKQAAKEAVIILVAASIIGIVVYAVRPEKIPRTSVVNAPGENASSAEEKGGANISIDEAYRLYTKQQAIFVDARHGVDYAAGHIKGAVNLAVAESESWLSDFLAATDPATPIITYCDGENCHLAPELAQFLFFNGFDHVFYLENGWTRWRQKGFPVE